MAMKKFVNSNEAVDADDINNMYAEGLVISGKNLIRQLIDRAGVWSADQTDWWGDAYVDADGRDNSVDTGETDSIFDTDKYKVGCFTDEASGDATSDPNSVTTPSNAFDDDDDTYAEKTFAGAALTTTLGKTFSSKYVYACYYKAAFKIFNAVGASTIKIQTYDGSTWSTIDTYTVASPVHGQDYTESRRVAVDDTIQGLRLEIVNGGGGSSSGYQRYYTIEYGPLTSSIITHNIPSGTFSDTISSSLGTFIAADWEEGADVQYKLTGTAGAEDSGWLNTNEVSEFTAFTAEPDTMIVKLIPKTTSPTAGYPSLRGVSLRAV